MNANCSALPSGVDRLPIKRDVHWVSPVRIGAECQRINMFKKEIKNNDDATNVVFNVAAHFLARCLMGIEFEATLFILAKVTQHVIGIITTDDNIPFNRVTH